MNSRLIVSIVYVIDEPENVVRSTTRAIRFGGTVARLVAPGGEQHVAMRSREQHVAMRSRELHLGDEEVIALDGTRLFLLVLRVSRGRPRRGRRETRSRPRRLRGGGRRGVVLEHSAELVSDVEPLTSRPSATRRGTTSCSIRRLRFRERDARRERTFLFSDSNHDGEETEWPD